MFILNNYVNLFFNKKFYIEYPIIGLIFINNNLYKDLFKKINNENTNKNK
jgi:hypothetical protein